VTPVVESSLPRCSVAGHGVHDLPGIGMYAASKYSVTALTEALRKELVNLKSKIRITVRWDIALMHAVCLTRVLLPFPAQLYSGKIIFFTYR
jgi:NADP-dependent 3-hydroxy acid dehydrogenase YdfG